MRRLYVWIRRANGDVALAGELAATEPGPGGRFEAEFEYSSQWLRDSGAFSLDPASLPLQSSARFRSQQFDPPLGIFDDALPDDWGRQLLARALTREGRKPYPPEMLLALRGEGTGALVVTDTTAAPGPPRTLPSRALAALLSAAAKFEAGTLRSDDEFRQLLEGSSRAGGARPKALVHDPHGEWLAKFPSRSRDAGHDLVGLEATCLQLARSAALAVPDTRLQAVGRKRVLMVRRFDVTESGGRIHMVSLRTLFRERPGVYVAHYSDLALALSKYSARPAADVAALFRHMVFNAAIGNVDDHLKNFWMVVSPAGYRLAPAFDLVPDISQRREHTLAFQYDFACPQRAVILELAREWQVPDPAAVIDQVVAAAATFRSVARELRVRPGAPLDAIAADVDRRVALLAG